MRIDGKAVTAMLKKAEHKAVTFHDDHTGQEDTAKIYKVTLKNGKIGIALAGTASSINAFDFDSMTLSRTSIGGVFYNRPMDGTLEEAVQKYNDSVMFNSIKIEKIEIV